MEGIAMKHYSKEFKEEALKLSDEIGVKKAAQQLGIAYYTLADWRSIPLNICMRRFVNRDAAPHNDYYGVVPCKCSRKIPKNLLN